MEGIRQEGQKVELEQALFPPAKHFSTKLTFKNVYILRNGNKKHSKKQNHFDTFWLFFVLRRGDYLEFGTEMMSNGYEIEADLRVGTILINSTVTTQKNVWISNELLKWESVKGICNGDGSLKIEVEVVFTRIEDTRKENLRNFDSSMAKFSDVTLVIQNQKFYVSKLFLAAHSTYFETLFLGGFRESGQSEIQLHGLDPNDFQKYLEVLYGHPAITDRSVEGILLIADGNDTGIVKGKCQDFLLGGSWISVEKKIQMFLKYHLDEGKIPYLVNSAEDFEKIPSEDLEKLDEKILAHLLRNCNVVVLD